MKLRSMKMSAKESKDARLDEPVSTGSSKGPSYPWGLTLNLEDESIKKLGIDFANQQVGDDVFFVCKAKVTSMSENAHKEISQNKTEKNKSMALQITNVHWGKPSEK